MKKERPKIVYDYIATIEPTIKVKTCAQIGSCLAGFHHWIKQKKLAISKLNRQNMIQWFAFLKSKELHPGTRVYQISTVRKYLYWVYENKIIDIPPEELIRRGDFPKVPSYLPRPLPIEADFKLQERLANSDNQLHHGLLLMRQTGLRIGELMNLQYDCIRKDHNEVHFIKVPIGKLYNERLVPIEDETVKLIHQLQQQTPTPRTWLFQYGDDPEKRPSYSQFRKALIQICEGLEITEPVSTHRFRHSYATSLLNAGVSLFTVMKLLGHKDYRMTLRYAAVTQETVIDQYFDAAKKIHLKYRTELKCSLPQTSNFDPVDAFSQVILWLQDIIDSHPSHNHAAQLLYRRLQRAKKDLEQLKKSIERTYNE